MKQFSTGLRHIKWKLTPFALLISLFTIVVIVVTIITLIDTNEQSSESSQPIIMRNRVLPVLGIIADDKLKVVEIEAGGGADKAGIKVGDVLSKLENISFTSANQAMQLFQESQLNQGLDNSLLGKEVNLVIIRTGKELLFKITPGPRKVETPISSNNTTPGFIPTPTAVPEYYLYL